MSNITYRFGNKTYNSVDELQNAINSVISKSVSTTISTRVNDLQNIVPIRTGALLQDITDFFITKSENIIFIMSKLNYAIKVNNIKHFFEKHQQKTIETLSIVLKQVKEVGV